MVELSAAHPRPPVVVEGVVQREDLVADHVQARLDVRGDRDGVVVVRGDEPVGAPRLRLGVVGSLADFEEADRFGLDVLVLDRAYVLFRVSSRTLAGDAWSTHGE